MIQNVAEWNIEKSRMKLFLHTSILKKGTKHVCTRVPANWLVVYSTDFRQTDIAYLYIFIRGYFVCTLIVLVPSYTYTYIWMYAL